MATDMITQSNSAAAVPKAVPAPSKAEVGTKTLSDSSQGQPVQQQAQRQAEASPELDAAVSKVSEYFQNVQRNLNFSVDEDSGVTVVKVFDSESEELIRQFPSDEMLTLARRLDELSGDDVKGVLVESRA